MTSLSNRGRPTIWDVASRANVSIKTVSRVLNAEPGVAEATAERVRSAVADLGFRRNDSARMLRTGATARTISLVVDGYDNPNFSVLAKAIAEVAAKNGYLLLIASSERASATERRAVRGLVERGVEGLVMLSAGDDHSYLSADLEAGLATVFVEQPAGRIHADAVIVDNVDSARQATSHLLRRWHRRIALVAPGPDVRSSAQWVEGYRAALAETGIQLDPDLLKVRIDSASEAEAAARQLGTHADPPTAIVAASTQLTAGVAAGIEGTSMGLVGCAGPDLPDALRKRVTTVSYDLADMGWRAATLLLKRLQKPGLPVQQVVVPVTLTPRGSGEVRPRVGGRRAPVPSWFRR